MRIASIQIRTPEGVSFSLPLAGPVTRFIAWLIDILLIGAAAGAFSQAVRVTGFLSIDAMFALEVLSYFVISVGYAIFFEWMWHGQTPGKRALGMRVLDAGGLRLQFSQIAVRNLLRFLDCLPILYLIGGAAMLLSARSQRLGDLVANTIVIRQRRFAAPGLEALKLDQKFNSFLSMPHLAGRLRQQVSPELTQIALEALMRRGQFSPDARLELFREIAERFRALVKFPDEISASLTDERYVHNALEVVMTKGNLRTSRRIAV